MSEQVQRATDEEAVKSDLIDEKTLTSIMKRFLGSKKSDPDVTKWYRVENGINFMATTFGTACHILFKNKFEGSFTKGTGENYFIKPGTNGKFERVEAIPEIETIKDGKKNIERPTGNYLEYPDVVGMFQKHNLDEYYKIEMSIEIIDEYIAVHEAMSKASKIGGEYNTANLKIVNNKLSIELYDSPLNFVWGYELDQKDYFYIANYYYDFDLMISILKSLKDLKPEKIEMYLKDISQPIFFIGKTTEYTYNFAINRKLVR